MSLTPPGVEPADVRAHLERLCGYRKFRGPKLRKLLIFLIEEWLRDGGEHLTVRYIAGAMGEKVVTESNSGKKGFPQTRGNLGHVRKRLSEFHQTEGYRDRVIVKLNRGSLVPVIAYNPISTATPDLDPAVEKLMARAKAAIDTRTARGALRAFEYFLKIAAFPSNPRQDANICFILMAIAPAFPVLIELRSVLPSRIAHVKASGFQPWEGIFAEAAIEASYNHDWTKSLELFALATEKSQGESKYLWWHTALLASQNQTLAAIEILSSAVRHFHRTNEAVRTDLALLQIMAGEFEAAEEVLSASLDFAPETSACIVFTRLVLFEAQDRIEEADAFLTRLSDAVPQERLGKVREGLQSLQGFDDPAWIEHATAVSEGHFLLAGMTILVTARMKNTTHASSSLDTLLEIKVKCPQASSVDIAIGMVALSRFDEAVEWLRKAAFEECDPLAMWFHIFPALRHLRNHDGYNHLLRELKLQRSR